MESTNQGQDQNQEQVKELGIENVKNVLGFAIDLTEATEKSLADGKFDGWDTLRISTQLTQLPLVVKSFKEFFKEIANLNPGESTEIAEFFKDKLDLEDDKAEQITEESMLMILNIGASVRRIMDIKNS